MKSLPDEIAKATKVLEKQGYVLERAYIKTISAQWRVSPAKVKRALRQGAGNRFFKCVWRATQMRRHYLFVEPVSARKWLAFALDRIVVEA